MPHRSTTTLSYSGIPPRRASVGARGVLLFALVVLFLVTAFSIEFVPSCSRNFQKVLPKTFPRLVVTGALSGVALLISLLTWPRARRNHRSSAMWLGQVARVISAATLTVVFAKEFFTFRGLLDSSPSSLSVEHLSMRMSQDLGISWSPRWVYVQGIQTGWNEKSEWFLFQLPPGEIDLLKASILGSDQHGGASWEVATSGVTSVFPISGDNAPAFWKPDDLPDPERLKLRRRQSGGRATTAMAYGFVFSRSTGKVYVYRW